MRLVGPVLYFRGQADDDRWRLWPFVVHPEGEEAPPLEPEGEAPARTALLASRRGRGLWRHIKRCTFQVSMPKKSRRI